MHVLFNGTMHSVVCVWNNITQVDKTKKIVSGLFLVGVNDADHRIFSGRPEHRLSFVCGLYEPSNGVSRKSMDIAGFFS